MSRLPTSSVPCQPYTVIGYQHLTEIHSVLEHLTAGTTEQAIEAVHTKLRGTHAEYDAACDEDIEALTVLAVFSGHLNEND